MFLQYALTFLLFSQDITLPETIKGEPSVFIPITAVTKGEVVQFVPLDAGLSVFPANLLTDKKTTVVVAGKSGRYRVLAYTSINNMPSNPAITTLIVGNPGPDKPDKPDPDKPDKPDPDKPDPDKPNVKPDQEFLDAVKSIYGGLQEPDKAASVKKLVAIYQLGLKEIDNPTHKTTGELFSAVRTFAYKNLPQGKIEPIREMLADKTDTEVGTEINTSLDAATKLKIKNNFNKILTALGGLNV